MSKEQKKETNNIPCRIEEWEIFKDKARATLKSETEMCVLRKLARRCDWRFFSNPGELKQSAALIDKYCPGEKQRLVATCEDILAHRFDLLGSGLIEMGEKINWHRDYNTCYDWPSDMDYIAMGRHAFNLLVDPIGDAELKFPWDLSNMMWIPSLVAADAVTEDSRYASAFASDIEDWMEQNPFPYGVNWFCAMNVAMRSINWIIGFTAFAPKLSSELQEKITYCLIKHGLFIAANLEIEQKHCRNNHYLTNIMGLYYLGHFFRDLEIGRQWLDFAKLELEMEIQFQFFSDGVCYENSTSYHRLSTEMLMLCAILGKQNDDHFSKEFLEQLHRAVLFTRDITPSNYLIPMFGDNDNGRMVQFYGFNCVPVRDHRHLLAVGGEFFDDDILRSIGYEARADAIWLTGNWKSPDPQPPDTFRFFHYRESAYMGVAGENVSWLIHNARIQNHERGGHAHCDAMSFTLNTGGIDLIVDPGSYCYSSQFEVRNNFRSVEYHNTVQINSSQMHEYGTQTFEELWRMKDLAEARTIRFEQKAEEVVFEGAFRSFQDDREWRIDRTMTLDMSKNKLSIIDSVNSAKDGTLVKDDLAFSRLTLGPNIQAKRVAYRQIELSEIGTGKRLGCIDVFSDHAYLRVRPLWFAPTYGERIAIQQIEVRWSPIDSNNVKIQLSF